jgi:hypothetical protein
VTSPLPPHRITIPDRKPDVAAADIVIQAFRRNGIDPRKAYSNPMCVALAQAWVRGEITHDHFNRACRNLLILNPKLGA